MIRLTLSVFLFTAVLCAKAQDGLMENVSEFKAAVQASSGSIESIESQFEQIRQLAVMASALRSSGTFYFERPSKVRWEYREPEPQSIIINDGDVHLIERGRVRKADARAARAYRQMNDVIADVIHGKAFANEAFSYTFRLESGTPVVHMRPTDASMAKHIETIELAFNANHRVQALTIHVPGGDFTHYRFFQQTYNSDIAEGVFAPKPLEK